MHAYVFNNTSMVSKYLLTIDSPKEFVLLSVMFSEMKYSNIYRLLETLSVFVAREDI